MLGNSLCSPVSVQLLCVKKEQGSFMPQCGFCSSAGQGEKETFSPLAEISFTSCLDSLCVSRNSAPRGNGEV